MPVWNPHKLAGDPLPTVDLAVGDRVRATTDLDGVPVGTEGEVVQDAGFAWPRFRVRFDNGVYASYLDGRHIEAAKRRRFRRG